MGNNSLIEISYRSVLFPGLPLSYVSRLTTGVFIGQDHWGVGDTIALRNNSQRTGTVTFSLVSQEDATDGVIQVFAVPESTINLPAPNQTTLLSWTDRGFGAYIFATFSRNKRQKITIRATLSAQPDGVAVSDTLDLWIAPKYFSDLIYRQNGYTGEVMVYSDYWTKVQPVNDVTKPLLLCNTGSVPLSIASKDTKPTDFTTVGVTLLPGESRVLSPLALGFYYWARVVVPSGVSPLDAAGKASYIQAG